MLVVLVRSMEKEPSSGVTRRWLLMTLPRGISNIHLRRAHSKQTNKQYIQTNNSMQTSLGLTSYNIRGVSIPRVWLVYPAYTTLTNHSSPQPFTSGETLSKPHRKSLVTKGYTHDNSTHSRSSWASRYSRASGRLVDTRHWRKSSSIARTSSSASKSYKRGEGGREGGQEEGGGEREGEV